MPSVGVGRMRGNPAVKTDSFGHEILSQLAQSCVACTSKCAAHREKISIITYRWQYTIMCRW
jgi:hypothetical protein